MIEPYLDWQSKVCNQTIVDCETCFNKFKYLFICPSFARVMFDNFLPIIALDACHTKGSYRGVILSSTGISVDGKNFLLAFAVAPTENSEFWKKFLEKLNLSFDLMHRDSLVILVS